MMALVTQRTVAIGRLQDCRGLAALAACLMLGACAQSPKPSIPNVLALSDEDPASSAPRSDLEKATEYWGKEFAQNPRDLQTALNYAKDLKAMGEKQRALAVLQQASLFHGQSRELASEYGRLALELDQISVANQLLAAADDPAKPDWRVISARGTVLAKQGKYQEAIPYYERALSLAHDHPSILSNLALAHAMNGEPGQAEGMLRKAAAANHNSLKIRQNLALVLGLQGKYDEAKQLASRDLTPENAAGNTDYLRRIVKLEPKASPMPEAAREVAQTDAQTEKANAGEISAKPKHVSERPQDSMSPISVAQWTPTVETVEPVAGR
jgi:Flp pilus assembly protein TadD